MNDQPLNDTELDIKIRSLVARAVADAPAPRPLPASSDAEVRTLSEPRSRRGLVLAGLGIAASLVAVGVVWSSQDDPQRVIPASSLAPETTASAPSTTIPLSWPADLVVVIASDRGIETVVAENGQPAVTRLETLLLGDVAFQAPDGSIVSQEGLIDLGLTGDRLVRSERDGVLWVDRVDALGSGPVQANFLGGIERLTDGLDVLVGTGTPSTTGGRVPLLITQAGGTGKGYWQQLGVPALVTQGDEPRLFSVSPSGSTVGWVHSDQFVLADGRSFPMPDGSKVVEVDLTDNYVALTRGAGAGTLIDLRTGDSFAAPAAGRLTISLVPVTTTSPATTAPDTTTPVVAPEPVDVSRAVITAGLDGVWRVVDGVATQLTTESMSMALQLPDGSVVMQRSSGWSGDGSAQSDSTLLVWRFGQIEELFPGETLDGWVRLYDVAMVNGAMTVLYAVEQEAEPFSVLVEAVLLARSLETWETTVVDAEFGGWEQGYSRLHLAETGLIVGEFYQEVNRSLFSRGIAGATPLDAATLGLDGSSLDCSDCPRLYTVRRDGTVLAWLEGTMLHIATPGLTATEQFDLGEAALTATNLELGNGFVVLSFGWNDPGAEVSLLIDLGTLSGAELPGVTAAIVTVPTPPWQIDEDLTAALEGQEFDTVDALYAAVEAQIEAIRYAAVEPVEPITFTRGVVPNWLTIAAPNFDDSVPQTWYRIVPGLGGFGEFHVIGRIESVAVCRDGTYSTPTHLCV